MSGLLLIAGAASLAIADGSSLLFVGMPGYAAWLVWLLVTGVRLVRARAADRPVDASTSGEGESMLIRNLVMPTLSLPERDGGSYFRAHAGSSVFSSY